MMRGYSLNNVYIQLKITEISGSTSVISKSIAKFTNSQNAMKDSDSLSQEGDLQRLKNEFNALPEPYFFEIQQGEWTTEDTCAKQTFDTG